MSETITTMMCPIESAGPTMTTQKKLPFDKREYAQRLESIELMQSKAISKGRLKCVKRFVAFLFSYEKSSYDGNLTLIANDEEHPHTKAILHRNQISVRTLANWIDWAKQLGVVNTLVDCDGYRTRRTTLSVIWSRVAQLSTLTWANAAAINPSNHQIAQPASLRVHRGEPKEPTSDQAGSLGYPKTEPESVPKMVPEQVPNRPTKCNGCILRKLQPLLHKMQRFRDKMQRLHFV